MREKERDAERKVSTAELLRPHSLTATRSLTNSKGGNVAIAVLCIYTTRSTNQWWRMGRGGPTSAYVL